MWKWRNLLVPVVDLRLHQVVDHGHGVLREAGYLHAAEEKGKRKEKKVSQLQAGVTAGLIESSGQIFLPFQR